MQEPTTRSELLARIRDDRSALENSVRDLTDQALSLPGPAGHWSAKDILWHVSWWEQRTIEKLQGLPTAHDLLGGPDNDQLITTINEQTFEEHSSAAATEVLASFRDSHHKLEAALVRADEHFVVANLEFIAENTYRHYPEHTRQIETWLTQKR